MPEAERRMRCTLKLARKDRLLRASEMLYRRMRSRQDGARYLALAIGRHVLIDECALVRVILEEWNTQ